MGGKVIRKRNDWAKKTTLQCDALLKATLPMENAKTQNSRGSVVQIMLSMFYTCGKLFNQQSNIYDIVDVV